MGNPDLHRRGNTIIMVTHSRIDSYAGRVITMLDGKIDTDEQEKRRIH